MSALLELAERPAKGAYIKKGAILSPCGRYRYRLWREWRGYGRDDTWHWMTDHLGRRIKDGEGVDWGEPKSVVFVMLNPSTADADQDDPTIRRCVGFAKAWGYDAVEIVNLFAYRATDPRELLALGHADDPVGDRNQRYIAQAIEEANRGPIIAAWGAHGGHLGQDETVLGWLPSNRVSALRVTKEGFPAHPLYLPAHLTPQPYNGCRAALRSRAAMSPHTDEQRSE